MDKWQTLQQFWESFGLPAYDEQTTFTEGTMPNYPHITYEARIGIINQTVSLTASLWYRSDSWEAISKKADEILAYIVNLRKPLQIDGGYFWVKIPETTPFAQRMASGSTDDKVKRIYLTAEAEYITAV